MSDVPAHNTPRAAVPIPADLTLGEEVDTARPGSGSSAGSSITEGIGKSPAAHSELQLARAASRARLELEPGVLEAVCVDHAPEVLQHTLMAL